MILRVRYIPTAVDSNYGSVDLFTKHFPRIRSKDDTRAGIPGVWFVQPWL